MLPPFSGDQPTYPLGTNVIFYADVECAEALEAEAAGGEK